MSSPVSYQLKDSVATITMDDGKVNALSLSMLSAINSALDRAEADRAVVLLTDRPGVFSACVAKCRFLWKISNSPHHTFRSAANWPFDDDWISKGSARSADDRGRMEVMDRNRGGLPAGWLRPD